MLHHSERIALKRKYVLVLVIALVLGVYAVGVGMTQNLNVPQVFDVASIMHAAAANPTVPTLPKLEMFLKFDSIGIQGDSNDTKHINELVIDSFSWGETRGVKDKVPGMEDFIFTMPVSRASPKLFLYGAGGSVIPKATFVVRSATGKQEFLKWTFTNALITSYRTIGNTHGDGVADQVTFAFDRLQMEYRQILPDGSMGEPVSAGFDRRSNASTGK